jgi:hypothetical protein
LGRIGSVLWIVSAINAKLVLTHETIELVTDERFHQFSTEKLHGLEAQRQLFPEQSGNLLYGTKL